MSTSKASKYERRSELEPYHHETHRDSQHRPLTPTLSPNDEAVGGGGVNRFEHRCP